MMLSNYGKVALRNLRKHKLYTGINLIGLAVGLACCTFLVLYVLDELNYERFHTHADRIVRVVENETIEGQESRFATTYGPLGPALEADLAAVEHAVRVLPYELLLSRDGDVKYQEDGILFVDSTFLEVFTFPLAAGTAATALDAPFSIVLTEAMAAKYFGDTPPVGQTLSVRGDDTMLDFTVTGIVENPPPNTHLQFDFLASFASMRTIYSPWVDHPNNWEHPPMYTYALVAEDTDLTTLEAQLPAFAERRMGPSRTASRSLHLEALRDIRLHSGRENDLRPGSASTYVSLSALIAFFILLLACINFMNLATAQAAGRAKEVGLRKALGAARGQLVRQFLAESMLMIAIALVLVFVLVDMLMPVFNTLADKALTTRALAHWSVPLVLLVTIVLVGGLAGSYPAFYLSRFRPMQTLKGEAMKSGSMAVRFRQSLVVFQFVISIALILGTLISLQQLDYMRNERLGFDKERVVLVPLRDMQNQIDYAPLKEAWQQLPGVAHVTASSGMPGLSDGINDWAVKPENALQDSLTLMVLTVDPDYIETYGLEMIAGRDFSEAFPSDATEAFLLNESAAQRIGWTDPIGQRLSLNVWFDRHYEKEGQVVGVVKDFQYRSLHQTIDPILFHILPNSYYYDFVSVKLHPGTIPQTLAAMEKTWGRFNTERPLEYGFLDEQFDALYQSDQRLSGLLGLFAALAIFIACLGLFGLAAFTAEQRTKEIGVRKVLGATVPGIVLLLSKDLLKLITIAFVIATPLTYVAMDRWLLDFASRIEITPGLFLLVGGATLLVAWLTVSVQAIRAALADPVKSLRYE